MGQVSAEEVEDAGREGRIKRTSIKKVIDILFLILYLVLCRTNHIFEQVERCLLRIMCDFERSVPFTPETRKEGKGNVALFDSG